MHDRPKNGWLKSLRYSPILLHTNYRLPCEQLLFIIKSEAEKYQIEYRGRLGEGKVLSKKVGLDFIQKITTLGEKGGIDLYNVHHFPTANKTSQIISFQEGEFGYWYPQLTWVLNRRLVSFIYSNVDIASFEEIIATVFELNLARINLSSTCSYRFYNY